MSYRARVELHRLPDRRDFGDSVLQSLAPWRLPWEGDMPYCDGCYANEEASCGFGWLWFHVYITERFARVCDGRCPRLSMEAIDEVYELRRMWAR
jgi:hypothetical protein